MKSILKLAAATIIASSPVQAFTFNDATATCLDCNISLNDLEPGDVFLLESGKFTTSAGDFDIRIEIVRRTQPKPEITREFKTTGASGFVQFRFNLVEQGSVTSTNLVGTTFDVGGQQFHIGIEDIDSNEHKDFTEYAGVDLNFSDPSPANIGTSLTKVEDFNLLDTRVLSSLFATEIINGKQQFIDPDVVSLDKYKEELAAFSFAYATGDTAPMIH